MFGLAALAAYIAVLTSAGDDEPSTRGALWGCVFTIAAGAAAGGIAAWQINSGRRDMVINNVVRTFRMPGGREIGYPDLKAIRIEVKVYRGRRSDSVSKIYFVWVDYIYQDVYRAKMLGHWDDFDEAQIFARWLGEKTDTPVKDREAALT